MFVMCIGSGVLYLQRNHNWFPDYLLVHDCFYYRSWFVYWLTRSIDQTWFSIVFIHCLAKRKMPVMRYISAKHIQTRTDTWMEKFLTHSAGSSMPEINKLAMNLYTDVYLYLSIYTYVLVPRLCVSLPVRP